MRGLCRAALICKVEVRSFAESTNRSRRLGWNTVAALGLMLSMASYLVLQDGALPKKKKPVAVITSKEIVKKTGRQ